MLLRHLHLPGLTPYARASAIQDMLVRILLESKSHRSSQQHPRQPAPAPAPEPSPTILTAEFAPVYTCGRREIGTVSASQQAYLRANGRAEFHEARRGGQTTFHGPGQMVAYPVVDLRRHGVSARAYVRDVLEEAVIRVLGRYGIRAFSTVHPGVWTSETRKIAAVGVHLRRNVASHGVAVNVHTDLCWFDRIVACGLEGMETTSLVREGVEGATVEEVAGAFVQEFAVLIGGVDRVERVGCEELVGDSLVERRASSRIDGSSSSSCGNEPD